MHVVEEESGGRWAAGADGAPRCGFMGVPSVAVKNDFGMTVYEAVRLPGN